MNNKIKLKLVILFSLFAIVFIGCSSAAVKNTSSNTVGKSSPVAVKPSPSVLPKENFKAPFKAPNQGIPVLMYHSVGYDKSNPNNEVVTPPEKLEEQFKYLKDNGYYTITLDDLYNYLEKNENVPQKSVVLTFDDGYKNNYSNLFPLLKKYGFRATIFMITAYVDKNTDFLTSAELKEMNAYGVDIESHTVNHDHLKTLTKDKQLETLSDSKAFLEKLLNKKINYIAYPYGEYNKTTLECAQQAGYKLALTTDGRWSMKKNGILSLDRVYISSKFNLDTFVERITNPNYKFVQ